MGSKKKSPAVTVRNREQGTLADTVTASLSKLASCAFAHDFTTRAATWPYHTDGEVVIPARCYWWWVKVVGEWTWDPARGSCGPEGDKESADSSFLCPTAQKGALVGYFYGKWFPYKANRDASRGGTRVYWNDSDATMTLRFWCNDWKGGKDHQYYNDNKGAIEHTIAYCLFR